MKSGIDDRNRCHLLYVEFSLNQRRFVVAVVKCLGTDYFWDTVYT